MIFGRSISTADGVVASHKPEQQSFGQESFFKRFAVGEQQQLLSIFHPCLLHSLIGQVSVTYLILLAAGALRYAAAYGRMTRTTKAGYISLQFLVFFLLFSSPSLLPNGLDQV
jgi:tetrahydromethanopterin S-methyltransferase subunit C